ncbi:MAG: DUF6114 domain-containing protein, partial [Candidatus Thermoplasmatota archaeon]|nr:DUF6114 domain-containing protein [Candidatus Thermoplasmatota archaeon]
MARIEKSIIDSAVASAAAGFIIAGVGITILVHGFLFGLVGVAWGTGIIAVSILSLYYPGKHFMLGSLIIILSIASWYGTSGGLIIGFIIGVIGGFMTLSW